MTVAAILMGLVRHPLRNIVRRWNWKSATLSAVSRSLIFCVVNLQAGPVAGLQALAVEFCFRAATAGFYGGITQAFSGARPVWAASIAALVLLPAVAHGTEFLVHTGAGTAKLGQSIGASVLFTVITTAFNLFAMRRNVLTVGSGSRSLVQDMRELPKVFFAFVTAIPRATVGRVRGAESVTGAA